ncbi:hypothetical protein SAY86_026712 [Trapa natans]|uniref:Uncharacterized protein n=1 Tax=Trapa natans TaxID=22666 RepID=A0AAN7KM87_TRANT|nr:hypothetical protein SAY86_026712 [Trapa natans]
METVGSFLFHNASSIPKQSGEARSLLNMAGFLLLHHPRCRRHESFENPILPQALAKLTNNQAQFVSMLERFPWDSCDEETRCGEGRDDRFGHEVSTVLGGGLMPALEKRKGNGTGAH